MEIIKPGKTYKSTYSGKISCKKCGCIFNYSDNDIEYIKGPTVGVITNGVWVSSKTSRTMVYCPHCGKGYRVHQKITPKRLLAWTLILLALILLLASLAVCLFKYDGFYYKCVSCGSRRCRKTGEHIIHTEIIDGIAKDYVYQGYCYNCKANVFVKS